METTLHRQLKERYATRGAPIEQRVGRYRIDVVQPRRLVEIQLASLSAETTFDAGRFYRGGGTTLYGLFLGQELQRETASTGLARLARLIADGKLAPQIDIEAPWTEIADVAAKLMARHFTGKAVLHL